MLPELPYDAWRASKLTLHLWCQIVGKIALHASALRNHWWNMTLGITARGVGTRRLHADGVSFEIELDLVDHRAIVRADRREAAGFGLHDGLSVAEFYTLLKAALERAGVRVPIVGKPYGIPGETTRFAEDREHHAYDALMVRRWWDVVRWSADVMERFASEFAGKQSPAHLFWHSFDLALGRYSGRRASGEPPSDPVAREAYSHEVIAVGFWAGDAKVAAPTYYTYTAPEPPSLTAFALRPAGAAWVASGSGHMGTIPYDAIRTAPDPHAALLAFMRSGYEAGAAAAGWDVRALAHAP